MLYEEKGVYPKWYNDSDIINLVLLEIFQNGGKLPYTYVINPTHHPDTQKRMKTVLSQMVKSELILPAIEEGGYIERSVEGRTALHVGYKKYIKQKKWNDIVYPIRRFFFIFFIIIALAIVITAGYFILHYLKVL